MDVESDVAAVLGQAPVATMQADPHGRSRIAGREGHDAALDRNGGVDSPRRTGRAREDGERPVAFVSDDETTPVGNGVVHDPVVSTKERRPGIGAHGPGEPGRPLDVTEQEADLAGGQAHRWRTSAHACRDDRRGALDGMPEARGDPRGRPDDPFGDRVARAIGREPVRRPVEMDRGDDLAGRVPMGAATELMPSSNSSQTQA